MEFTLRALSPSERCASLPGARTIWSEEEPACWHAYEAKYLTASVLRVCLRRSSSEIRHELGRHAVSMGAGRSPQGVWGAWHPTKPTITACAAHRRRATAAQPTIDRDRLTPGGHALLGVTDDRHTSTTRCVVRSMCVSTACLLARATTSASQTKRSQSRQHASRCDAGGRWR